MKKLVLGFVFSMFAMGVMITLAMAPVSAYALVALDLNTAPVKQLEALPGVGPKVAADIVAARPFKSVDDLKKVKGIGDKKFAKLAPMLTVGAPAPAATEVAGNGLAASGGAMNALAGKAAEKAQGAVAAAKISLNSATKEDLAKLPGIGPERAQAIISGRPYTKIEDVMKVKGIQSGIFEKIKDSVKL